MSEAEAESRVGGDNNEGNEAESDRKTVKKDKVTSLFAELRKSKLRKRKKRELCDDDFVSSIEEDVSFRSAKSFFSDLVLPRDDKLVKKGDDLHGIIMTYPDNIYHIIIDYGREKMYEKKEGRKPPEPHSRWKERLNDLEVHSYTPMGGGFRTHVDLVMDPNLGFESKNSEDYDEFWDLFFNNKSFDDDKFTVEMRYIKSRNEKQFAVAKDVVLEKYKKFRKIISTN